MEFEDLGRIWRDERTGDVRRLKPESLKETLERASRVEEGSRRRIRRAAIIWLALVPWFGFWTWFGLTRGGTLVGLGSLVTALGLIIPWILFHRSRPAPTDTTIPVVRASLLEIRRIGGVERLMDRTTRWALTTLLVGPPMIFLGAWGLEPRTFVWILLSLLAGVVTWKASRRSQSRLASTREDLEEWLDALEGSD